MKVFMIGGTGLLGSAAAAEFIKRGHSVKTIALPELPKGAELPKEMELTFGSFFDMSDEEILKAMEGCDCFVFAAGVDERVDFPKPVYPSYIKYNIEPVRRFLTLSKQAGITKAVILGSYFAHFAKVRPEMELTKIHPYIRSRIEQEEVALSFADDGSMDVSVMELPYIFGTQTGRKPVWTIFIEQIAKMGPVTMYPTGGTAMVTVRQVAEAIVGAAELNKGGNAYPIAMYNYSWDDYLKIVHRAMGQPNRPIIHVPKALYKAFAVFLKKGKEKEGIETGLDYVELAEILYSKFYIESKAAKKLGVKEDNIDANIYESMKLSVEAYYNGLDLLEMKAE